MSFPEISQLSPIRIILGPGAASDMLMDQAATPTAPVNLN